jgi:hypothetical protein
MGDISKLPSYENTFVRLNASGLLEVISEETGDVIAVQRSIRDLMKEKNERLQRMDMPDGTVVFYEKGVNLEQAQFGPKYGFDSVVAGVICQRIAEGRAITKLSDDGLPPYSIICKWRAINPEFNRMVEIAIRDRGHTFADKAVDAAEKTNTKDEAMVQRLKTDTYKWMAEKSSPDEYGTKTQVRGDKTAPLTLIVDTGVPAPESRDVTSIVDKIEGTDGRDQAAAKDT